MNRDDITVFIHIIPTSADDKKNYDEAPDQNNFTVASFTRRTNLKLYSQLSDTLKVRKYNNNGTREKNLKD